MNPKLKKYLVIGALAGMIVGRVIGCEIQKKIDGKRI